MICNFLSFDAEEYFHGLAYSHIPETEWGNLEPRIHKNLGKILLILGQQKATFFVLGWIAKKYPDLLRELNNQGHEIACHGNVHKSIWDLTEQEFREDLIRAKSKIEEIICTEVIGYRAPTFSITKETYWALDIIKECGFKYDSSIFPVIHHRYGIPDAPRMPYQPLDDFWEIPLSTVKVMTRYIPFGGGGYFRILPYWLTSYFIRKNNNKGFPAVFYQHPWELDNKKLSRPRTPLCWLRRNLTMGSTEDKLKRLLREHKFIPIRDWVDSIRKLPSHNTGRLMSYTDTYKFNNIHK